MLSKTDSPTKSDVAVPRQSIVVIDDDVSIRRALERLFRSAGMAVESFESAEDFLAAEGLALDCLVLDVRMPGMSGLELQKRLIDGNRHFPVVFISAHEDEVARQRGMSAGAAGWLHKPFEDEALLQAIRQAVVARSEAE